jgi:effector-binding domain-containing protein
MFKIGDFSRLSRVSIKALRYYDEIGILKPAEVDRFTGYRYYSAEQLPWLNRIISLKNLGLSLDEIAGMMSSDPPLAGIQDILRSRLTEIRKQLSEDQERILRMGELLKQMEKEGTMPAYEVVVKKTNAQIVASVRDVIPSYGEIGRLYGEIFAYLGRDGVAPMGPPMAIFYDEEYKEQNVDLEAAVPINKKLPGAERIRVRELPAVEQMACVVHRGDYSNISQAYNALMTWIDRNRYRIAGNDREIYLRGPGDSNDPTSYVTEVQFPIEKA